MPFLGKKRSLLIFYEAISSLFTPFQEAENGTAEARQGFGRGGEAPLCLQSERTSPPHGPKSLLREIPEEAETLGIGESPRQARRPVLESRFSTKGKPKGE